MKPGTTNNPNGRPKGKPNKITAEMRKTIAGFLAEEFDQIRDRMEDLTAKERMDCLIKLLPYVIPRFLPIQDSSPDEDKIREVIETLRGI